jgi:hypothetical protein
MSKILSNWLQKQYKKERSKDPRGQGAEVKKKNSGRVLGERSADSLYE